MNSLFPDETAAPTYVEVAVPVPLHMVFSYRVPPDLLSTVQEGSRVLVPFGAKLVTGVVLKRLSTCNLSDEKVKPVLRVLDAEPLMIPILLELTQWLSEYCLAPIGECLRLFFPPGMEVNSIIRVSLTPSGKSALWKGESVGNPSRAALMERIQERGVTTVAHLRRNIKSASFYTQLSALRQRGWVDLRQDTPEARVKEKKIRCYCLSERGREILAAANPATEIRKETMAKHLPKQLALLKLFSEFPAPLSEQQVKKETGATGAVLKGMTERGWLELIEKVISRRSWQREWHGRINHVELTNQQNQVLEAIREAFREGYHRPILLHGVTGSGKTEVYVRLVKEVLAAGGQALVLVPEIGLTPAALHIYRAHFGNQVALLHSGLSEGERHDEWWRVRRGEASLVVGTRSAIFAPLQQLRLIIIDEEHDASYKQDESPRYHARDVAIWRAFKQGAVVLLGSATPSVETYYHATVSGKWRCLTMNQRVQNRPLAKVDVVDMQEEFLRHGPSQVLSDTLKENLKECLESGQQALVLLNRRGFSPVFLCRSCGFVLNCDHCSSPMTFHQSEYLMLCHHCRRFKAVPQKCPQCNGSYIYYVGEGTEKLQQLLEKLFPGYRIDRMDADTVSGKGGYFRVLNGLLKGETDLLVGTQMIAKGHDFPNVTLSAVVAADRGLSVPDFRAAERTFQLLTQVAGRSGRGEMEGKVVIQTRYPNHYSLRCACRQDYPAFFQQEIEYRRSLVYPPFCVLALLSFREADLEAVKKYSLKAANLLSGLQKEMQLGHKVRILGPSPAALEKVKGQFRYQILLKAQSRKELTTLLRRSLSVWKEQGLNPIKISIDIDPQSLL